jgi:hypothetical protein
MLIKHYLFAVLICGGAVLAEEPLFHEQARPYHAVILQSRRARSRFL